jgi:hypothetical protein
VIPQKQRLNCAGDFWLSTLDEFLRFFPSPWQQSWLQWQDLPYSSSSHGTSLHHQISGAVGIGVDLLFFLLKVIVVMFFSVSLVRVVMARFRINTVVSLYWGWLTCIGLVGMFLIIIDGTLLAGGCWHDKTPFSPMVLRQLFRRPATNFFPAKNSPPRFTGFLESVSAGKASVHPPIQTPPRYRGKISYDRDTCSDVKCVSGSVQPMQSNLYLIQNGYESDHPMYLLQPMQ